MALSLQDLAAVANAARLLYEYGFSQSNSAARQYKDFGEEIKNLGQNLDSIVQCVTRLQQERDDEPPGFRSGSNFPRLDTSTLLEVCGDFKGTIKECEKLLKDHIGLTHRGGKSAPLTNIKWNMSIKSEVIRFSSRLAFHNRKILLALEPFKLQLVSEANMSWQRAVQYLARGQETNTRRLEAMLSKALRFRGESIEPASPDPEPLNVPSKIERHLEDTFKTARRSVSDSAKLSIKDGYNGMRYHLDRATGTFCPDGADSTPPALDRYLHLLKAIFIFNKIKSSSEYINKVRNSRNVLWSCMLEDLEERCRLQLQRYSISTPENEKLEKPSDEELEFLYQDSYIICFDVDEAAEDNLSPGINLGTSDEISYLTLQGNGANEEHKLGIVRLSPEELELRETIFVKNRGDTEKTVTPLHVNLRKAVLNPIWALKAEPQRLIIRFRGDVDSRSEGQFAFTSFADLYEFQQAILGYKVSYNSGGLDVDLTIHDQSRASKEMTEVKGKFEVWQDRILDAVSTPPSSFQCASSATLSGAQTSGFNQSLRSPSQTSFWGRSRRDSHLSISSTLSSTSSRRTYTSSHTSPIGSPDGNTSVWNLKKTTEPMLVFIMKFKSGISTKFGLLGIKLDPDVNTIPGCNSSKCRSAGPCRHLTVRREKNKPLRAFLVHFAQNEGWNLAALGKYQQESNSVETPEKLIYVHIRFTTEQDRSDFMISIETIKQLWNAAAQGERMDRRNIEKESFIKQS